MVHRMLAFASDERKEKVSALFRMATMMMEAAVQPEAAVSEQQLRGASFRRAFDVRSSTSGSDAILTIRSSVLHQAMHRGI